MSQSSTLLNAEAAGTVTLQNATQFSPQGIVSRTLVSRPGLRITLFGFAAGQELTEHASPSRALIQILSGSSEWTINGQSRRIDAGELLHLPPNAPHAVRAKEPFSMLLTLVRDVAAPPVSQPEPKNAKQTVDRLSLCDGTGDRALSPETSATP